MPGGYFQQLAARYLLSQDQAPRAMAGASQLGGMMAGVPQQNANLAQMSAARQQMGAIGQMERARELQMRNVATAGLPAALTQLGAPPAYATLIGAGQPFLGSTQAVGQNLTNNVRQQMLGDIVGGNSPAAVNLSGALATRPLVQTANQGNTLVSPYLPPNQQAVVGGGPTPLGVAMAATQAANQGVDAGRLSQLAAAAGASRASAGLAGANTALANARTGVLTGAAGGPPTSLEALNHFRTQIQQKKMTAAQAQAQLRAQGYGDAANQLGGHGAAPAVGIPPPTAAVQ